MQSVAKNVSEYLDEAPDERKAALNRLTQVATFKNE
jgi:hypothetical protein